MTTEPDYAQAVLDAAGRLNRRDTYTAAQLARSDALAAAAWVLNAFTLDDIAETLLDVARPLATWIEHGAPATPQT